MGIVSVRYIVDDVEAAIAFYTKHLSFSVDLHPAPGFAMLSRGDLRLLLKWATSPAKTGTVRLVAKDGKATEGRYVVVWKRTDGKWKLQRDIWNAG